MSIGGSLAVLLAWSLAASPAFAGPTRASSIELPSSAVEAALAPPASPAAAIAVQAEAQAGGPPQASLQAAALGASLAPAAKAGPAAASAAPALDHAFDGAGFLEAFQAPPAVEAPQTDSFVEPNELHPDHARPILEHARPGAYVSVGTERSFIGAAMADATHLVLVDRSRAVTMYNRANIALLRWAADREQYLALRRTSVDGMLRVGRRLGWSDERLERLLPDLELFQRFQPSHILHMRTESAFTGVNYVRDERLFSRLKRLADAGRAAVVRMSLDDEPSTRALAAALAAAGVRLGVLDASNSWHRPFMGEEAFSRLVRSMSPVADSRSIVMVTRLAEMWRYHGFLAFSRRAGTTVAADLTETLHGLGDDESNGRLRRVKAPRKAPR